MPAIVFLGSFDYSWKIGGLWDYDEREEKFVQRAFQKKYAELKRKILDEKVYAKEVAKKYDYYDYMANVEKSVGNFSATKDFCDDNDRTEFINFEKNAQSLGLPRYRGVCSFDNKFLEENEVLNPLGLIDHDKLRDAVRKSMAAMFDKTQKIDSDNVIWSASIHTNTDNIHVHWQFVEKEKRKKKGALFRDGDKIEIEAFDKFKTTMIKTLTKQSPLLELTKFQKDVLIPCTKELLQTPTDKMLALRQLLPQNKNLWEYGRKVLDDIRPLIDETVLSIIRADEKSLANYYQFQDRLSEIRQKYVEWFGDGFGHITYVDKKSGEVITKFSARTNIPLRMYNNYAFALKKELGNALLKHMRNLPDESFHFDNKKLDTLNIELYHMPINDADIDVDTNTVDDITSDSFNIKTDKVKINLPEMNLHTVDFRDENYTTAKELIRKSRNAKKEDNEKRSLFESAIRCYSKSAENGNIVSALQLAKYYKHGHKYLEQNEEYGDLIYSSCYYAISSLLLLSKDTPKFEFLNDWCSYRLGMLLQNGDGITKDDKEALNMFLSNNSSMCRYAAASIYYRGTEHIDKSYIKALDLLKDVNDNPYASMIKGNIYTYGDQLLQPDSFKAKEEYSNALRLFLEIKDKSEYDNYNIGKIYYKGLSGEKNIDLAVDYLQKAEQENNVDATELLGSIFLFEPLYENYRTKGIELMLKAKQQKSKSAAFELGKYYLQIGNIESAVDNLMYASVTNNNINAQYKLGKLFYEQNDTLQAKTYLTMAANQNNSYAEYLLGKIALDESDYPTAETLFLKSALHDNDNAMYALGKMYLQQGEKSKAVKWLTVSANKNNNKFAQYELGKYYADNGIIERGKEYLLRSADNGFSTALYKLALIENRKQNYPDAIYYITQYLKSNPDNKDNGTSLHILGNLYIKVKDYDKASACLTMSIADGCKEARYTLGKLYTQKDHFFPSLALPLLKQSADEDNNTHAQMTLGLLYLNYFHNPVLAKKYIDKAYENGLSKKQYIGKRFKPRSPIVNASALSIARRVRIVAEIQTQKLINEFERTFNENVERRKWENEHNQTISI